MPEPPSAATLSKAAFAHLLESVQRPLYAFVRSLVGAEEQAQDILQDVFFDAWRAAQSGTPPFESAENEDGIRRWLFHAAYCDAISVLRHRKLIRWKSLDTPDVPESNHPRVPEMFEDRVLERQVVRTALASLGPEETAVLLLNAIQGYTATEIAELLGISADASKKRLSRAKQHLRAAYFAQHHDSSQE
jgi:RNA polymerase sigma-70 factor (ECF subfamily)